MGRPAGDHLNVTAAGDLGPWLVPCHPPTIGGMSGTYLHWGVISISLTNLAIIGAMLVIFVLALLLPFPHGALERPPEEDHQDGETR